ncbi:DapH/DapD/GlmU-related protein [Desulfobulbus oligotrophicus]|uniref:Acyltransferase n=1 Tax=Desulfobulbus oligotrophicus TaxID=1909699 RepID=A0A7T6APN0_9BACT|nr:DapH/DapD/GlmU-related protein [Desulfobulbus oligotrophicus]QQG64717.1 hypothetical protein HP555_01970 [Desulfobulbus oligotrophicus]
MTRFTPPLFSRMRLALFRFIHRKNPRIQVGEGLRLDCWLSIKGPGLVTIGDNCVVSALPGSAAYMTTLYTNAPEACITIGNNVSLVSARFSSRFAIHVGDGVLVEDASLMDTDFHTLDISRQTPKDETRETCSISIGRDVYIGARAFVTKGVVLEEGTKVYPGAVVQKSWPAQTLLIGNPAKPFQPQ